MKYRTPAAFRAALEARLSAAKTEGVGLSRLRKRVAFERLLVRLQLADPGAWILKGGFALELRFGEGARTTKDMDLDCQVNTTALDADRLMDAIREVFKRRATHPTPATVPAPPGDWEPGWRALSTDLPADDDLYAGHQSAASLLDPVLDRRATGCTWNPRVRAWT